MKKLKLELDELQVESFDTSATAAQQRGTVQGNEYCCCCCCYPCCCGGSYQYSCGGSCDASCNGTCFTCEVSCNGTCQTCEASCGGSCYEYTCGGCPSDFSCYDSCDYCPTGGYQPYMRQPCYAY